MGASNVQKAIAATRSPGRRTAFAPPRPRTLSRDRRRMRRCQLRRCSAESAARGCTTCSCQAKKEPTPSSGKLVQNKPESIRVRIPNTRRTSTVVLEYPWHRYGMALCFFLVLVRVVVLIPGMFNSLCDVFYLLFEGFLVYQSLSSKIPPYDSENPGYLRVSSLVQAGTPNSTPQTPHRGYLLPEAMIGQFLPQELSLSCGGRRESEHRRR